MARAKNDKKAPKAKTQTPKAKAKKPDAERVLKALTLKQVREVAEEVNIRHTVGTEKTPVAALRAAILKKKWSPNKKYRNLCLEKEAAKAAKAAKTAKKPKTAAKKPKTAAKKLKKKPDVTMAVDLDGFKRAVDHATCPCGGEMWMITQALETQKYMAHCMECCKAYTGADERLFRNGALNELDGDTKTLIWGEIDAALDSEFEYSDYDDYSDYSDDDE